MLVFAVAFFISLYGIISVPNGIIINTQDLMLRWMLILLAFNLLVAFASILVALWVSEDADNLKVLESRLKKLEQERNGSV
jgi:hypothetical protein